VDIHSKFCKTYHDITRFAYEIAMEEEAEIRKK